jgi:predicted RNA-binding protein with RPS1 domain
MNGENTTDVQPRDVVAETPETVAAESAAAPPDEPASVPAPPAPLPESAEAPLSEGATTVEFPVVEAAAPVADDSAEPEQPRRKVQLNPTPSAEMARPVPTYAAGETAAADAATAMPPVPEPDVEPVMAQMLGTVDVPSDAPLSEDMEAEINAALAGAMSAPPPQPVAAGTDAAPLPALAEQLEPGTKLKAKVQSLSAEHVFCDVGYPPPGAVPIKQFPTGKHPNVGEEFLVVVDKYDPENGMILVSLPKATRRPRGNWEELQQGQIVECVVNKTNKGGLEVTVSNMRAFLPASQVDLGFVSSLDSYVGQKFPVQVTEVNPAKRNLVVSRRVLLIAERKEKAATFWQSVEVGQQFAGTVKTIKDYGAFVDLGGVDGFLHVGEMSWTRIKHPSDILQEGQAVDVVVLSLDREKQKIGLGMRQLAQNPWNLAVDKYPVGRDVSGKVTRTTDFGAFIELEPGVEGLVHISELDHRRVKRVADVLTVGQEAHVQVLEVQPDRQRISLSLKALKPKPEEPKEEDQAPGKGAAYERKRKEPLRGGTGGSGGTGLFGNPGDFQ